MAVVEEGDEVVLLDPVYETYQSCIILAGGTPVSLATCVKSFILYQVRDLMYGFHVCKRL